ncbi:MAG: response regulator [Planctomycetaceae bacterium]
MTTQATIRIFIVEDHPIVRDGYELLLASEDGIELCGFASKEQDALDGMRRTKPDVAIIDLQLDNGGSGLELIEQVKNEIPSVRMLVVSASDESLFAERAIAAGALGYLSKTSGSQSLVEAIRQVSQGEIVLSPESSNRVLKARLGHNKKSVGDVSSLTNREIQIFRLLGEGDRSAVIAEKLLISQRTVERHCENIKQKLNLPSGRELLRRATLWLQVNQ